MCTASPHARILRSCLSKGRAGDAAPPGVGDIEYDPSIFFTDGPSAERGFVDL